MQFFARLFGAKKKKKEIYGRLKLYSMRKVEDKSIFKIEKRQIFLAYFRELLKNIGFSDVSTWHYDPGLNREFPIQKLTNFCDTFRSKSHEIDIIFTQNKVVAIVKSSDGERRKFVEELMKFCEWQEPKRKIQPLRKNF